jgi:hypothetical protein
MDEAGDGIEEEVSNLIERGDTGKQFCSVKFLFSQENVFAATLTAPKRCSRSAFRWKCAEGPA